MNLAEIKQQDWKAALRKEFNAIVTKYGSTSNERSRWGERQDMMQFNRRIFVLASGANSISLKPTLRALGLQRAIAYWIIEKTKLGYQIKVGLWSHSALKNILITADESLDAVVEMLDSHTGLTNSIKQLEQTSNGAVQPTIDFFLRLTILKTG